MKDKYTHVTMILDRSGSMAHIASDIVGGVNQFIEDQRAVDGDCTVTLVQFDSRDPYEIIRDFAPIKDVSPIGSEYRPRDFTPLYDAVGRGIVNTGERLSSLDEAERPSKVIVAIITDGLENASIEYTQKSVFDMINEQQEKYGWSFTYLGANQDAMAVGAGIGISAANSSTYDTGKTTEMLRSFSRKTGLARNVGLQAMNYTAEDKAEIS